MRLTREEKKERAPRPPKQPNLQDFQFFPPRLYELLDKELYAYWRQVNYVIPADPDEDDDARQERERDQDKVATAEPLTEDEIQEKESLLNGVRG
jgi:SWI/SNF-related matrix-associated actin-dependent regulator of chromatin subfamily A member 5